MNSGRKSLFACRPAGDHGRMATTAWDERYEVSSLLCSGKPNVWVQHYCEALPAGRLLDLAGGEGRNALWLAQRGWDVTVVDRSPCALDRARHCAGELALADRVHCIRADVRRHLPTGRGYDLVLIAYLQLPEAERDTVLNLAVSAVAPGGRLLWISHDESNVADGSGGMDEGLLCGPDAIAERVRTLGLAIVEAQTRVRAVEVEHGVRTALDTVVLATR